MRTRPPFLTVMTLDNLAKAGSYLGTVCTGYVRFVVIGLGWLVVTFTPLVSFDAGGGQTAIDIIRYVAFRGIDRDGWYAASPVFVMGGALSASMVLIGMVVHSVSLLSEDKTLALWGCGIILISLPAVILAASPIATVSIFGMVALPHIGWWLAFFYASVTLWSVCQWSLDL